MAKELPYFKFEPSEWQNGDIQMLEPQAQLTFINICCTYWTRLGKLPYAFALHKHCNGNTELLDMLINCNIIKVNDKKDLSISFLDTQLGDVKVLSSTRSDAANARWAKVNDANALQMESKSNAIRRDKIRGEEIKEEKKEAAKAFNFLTFLIEELQCDKQLIKDWLKVRAKKKAANTETAAKLFILQVQKSKLTANQILTECIDRSWAGFKDEWLTKPIQGTANQPKQDRTYKPL